MNIIEQIKNNNFFYNTCLRTDSKGEYENVGNPQVKSFAGADTEKLFKENLKTQPKDWYYRTNSVTYKLNSFGYRAPEFKDIKWEDSVVMFGCSNVFGTGLDEKDTIPYQLSELIGVPVINMGSQGTSIDFSLYNSIILKNICSKPKGVVHLWTHLYRATYYSENTPKTFGAWNSIDNKEYWNEWVKEHSHLVTHALFASMTSRHLWNNTAYYEASVFDKTAQAIGCDNFSEAHNLHKNKNDKARDLRHVGRIFMKAVAEQIVQKLKL